MDLFKQYELYLILDIDLTDKKLEAEVEKINKELTKKVKAENIVVNNEGAKKFAYPINKKWSGYYVSFSFDINCKNLSEINNVNQMLNVNENVVRYLAVDNTEFNKVADQQTVNENPEFSHHREYNKGRQTGKKDINKYLGKKVVSYKDTEYLQQFVSPYAKIFSRHRTGNTAKMQRKIDVAIKRARHMALMPFTTKHFS